MSLIRTINYVIRDDLFWGQLAVKAWLIGTGFGLGYMVSGYTDDTWNQVGETVQTEEDSDEPEELPVQNEEDSEEELPAYKFIEKKQPTYHSDLTSMKSKVKSNDDKLYRGAADSHTPKYNHPVSELEKKLILTFTDELFTDEFTNDKTVARSTKIFVERSFFFDAFKLYDKLGLKDAESRGNSVKRYTDSVGHASK